MLIDSIEYIENEGDPQEWSIKGLTFGTKNLIVGKNASGKSRALSIIYCLARNIAGLQGPQVSGDYKACFSEAKNKYIYEVKCKEQQIVFERLTINGTILLDRGEGGKGTIFAEKINTVESVNGSQIEFQSPNTTFAVFSRRDEIQHSYLEPLYLWAYSLRFYPFSTYLGKESLAIITPNAPQVDDSDFKAVIGVFREAKKVFKEDFINALKKDFASVDYHIDDIDVASPISIQVSIGHGEPVGIYVKESNLPGKTDQFSMSVGMFRVLSLLIHVNYFLLKKSASTVLVDDVGEGLDFDRSCRLIDLLRRKADEGKLQILLSTNDKFVMNDVPLEEWSLIQRSGNHVEVKNYSNSKEIFEDFKFTGLSNFSFLELDVINEPKISK